MDERETLTFVLAMIAAAVGAVSMSPAHWSVELALAPVGLELSARFLGAEIWVAF